MKAKAKVVSKELIAFAYVQEDYTRTGDITVGLMPIFAPIIHERAGQLFNATGFAAAVQEKYDIAMRPIVADGLIPKLVEAGLLIIVEQIGHIAVYRCAGDTASISPKGNEAEQILNAFCSFAEEALIQRNIVVAKEDLKNGFAQRLMDMQFIHELNGARSPIQTAEQGGSVDKGSEEDQEALALDILCAEYIIYLSQEKPSQFEFLLKMAAGALIADVVLTLQQPARMTDLSNLTVVLDGPLIMDMLNLNTQEHKQFGQDLLDMMRAAKVNLVTYTHIVDEMHGSIIAPLTAFINGAEAYGPLANRFRQTPSHVAYARAVVQGIEDFIGNLGIEIIDAAEFTGEANVVYCPAEIEDALRNSLGPLHERVEPRIIDAKSVASVIRMRKGVSIKSSVTDAKFIFVTRNTQLVKRTSDCLHAKKVIGIDDVPPSILDRQLAVILWLCLGGSCDALAREKLLANCMDALYPRPNLLVSVRRFIENLDPEKGRAFVALMRDKRAQSCLLHRTLGYVQAITQDNVGELLEELRRSTAQEVKEEAQRRERELEEKHAREYASQTAEHNRVLSDKERLLKERNELLTKRDEVDQIAIERACNSARIVEKRRKAIVLVGYVVAVAVVTYLSGKVGGWWVYPLCGLIALAGFWFVPEKLFKKWIDKAWQEKLLTEINTSKIEEWDKRFQLDRETCKARKIVEL